jgi:hypothetical protein
MAHQNGFTTLRVAEERGDVRAQARVECNMRVGASSKLYLVGQICQRALRERLVHGTSTLLHAFQVFNAAERGVLL